VQCLRNGDQVAAVIGQAADFGRRLTVVDAGMGFGLRQLLGGKIRGLYSSEMFRQCQRRLAIAGGAIPGHVPRRALPRQPGEQLGRIGRPVARIVRGMGRKVVGSQAS
jgi:hypothetical protein